MPRSVRGRVVAVGLDGAVDANAVGVVGSDGELALILSPEDAKHFAKAVSAMAAAIKNKPVAGETNEKVQ